MRKPPLTQALRAEDVPVRAKGSVYPAAFQNRVAGRSKRQLGNAFGLRNFGVNLTELAPGAESALLHRHSKQDEFVYVLEGRLTLRTDAGEQELLPGMCAGFPAAGAAHHLINRSDAVARYLEIGDRTAGDEGTYPEDDLAVREEGGVWVFRHKDGRSYD